MSLQPGHNEYCPEAYAPEPRGQVWLECPTCRTVWQADEYEEWYQEHDGWRCGSKIHEDDVDCPNPDCDGEDGSRGEEIDVVPLRTTKKGA